jgi:DNA-binding SARP family transcriptional activator
VGNGVVEIRILGPVEVWRADKPLPLARRQQRVILGILALDANALISCDRLIDLLWGERPPRQARATVQTRISELRSLLEPGKDVAIVTSANSYELRIDPDLVDAHRFRQAVSRARAAGSDPEARDRLRAGLALWRGPVLGGQVSPDTHAALCQGLESARLTATEDLFDIELKLGSHLHIVGEVHNLARTHPSRERLTGQLMTALHRAGRTSEALHHYEQWRRWLADELGIDPAPAVGQLHLAILRADPALTIDGGQLADSGIESMADHHGFTVKVTHLLPPDIADFTGRADEVARMRDLLTRRGGGVPAVAIQDLAAWARPPCRCMSPMVCGMPIRTVSCT